MPQDKKKKTAVRESKPLAETKEDSLYREGKGFYGSSYGKLVKRAIDNQKKLDKYYEAKKTAKYKIVASGLKSKMKTGGKMYKSFK